MKTSQGTPLIISLLLEESYEQYHVNKRGTRWVQSNCDQAGRKGRERTGRQGDAGASTREAESDSREERLRK